METRKYKPDQKYIGVLDIALDIQINPATVAKWVRLWIKLDTSVGRPPRGMGYSLPAEYLLVARGWMQSADALVREVMQTQLPVHPAPWLVVVGKEGYSCYTPLEASQQVTTILADEGIRTPVSVFYVGQVESPRNK